ncbi:MULTISPECIES: tRNA dihydrouridine synthase [unclassified Carboxylicivirga]|uniref:tRNA dihydrouridine synthase n=1 Tax=Carboxylicivirga TaxID=1628153 RepID=UPI003D33A0A1
MQYFLAPLQSYTTVFYRKAHATVYGAMDKYFTPFFEETGKDIDTLSTHHELSTTLNHHLNTIPQLAGNDADYLLVFARKVKQMGYHSININMGCPFPMLVKRQRGGGILQHPKKIAAMLDAFFTQTSGIGLSVKMRLGVDHPRQGQETLRLLNDYPLEEVIIHPRLVNQKYTGTADWDAFEEMVAISRHPLVANGDINTPEQAQKLTQRFPHLKALMLGRGLLSSPSLHKQLLGHPNKADILQLHDAYHLLIRDYYQDWNRYFNFLQTFWHYPLQGSTALKRHLRQLKKHNKPDLYKKWLSALTQHWGE